jgi:xanthine dehydrogenase/oxidase
LLLKIVNLQDAIKENSFFDRFKPRLTKNDFEGGIREAENSIKGEVHMAGQEHFYLETHCSLATPKEDNEMEIFSSTQNPAEIQVNFWILK